MVSTQCAAGQADLGAEPTAHKGALPGTDHARHGQERPSGVHPPTPVERQPPPSIALLQPGAYHAAKCLLHWNILQ